MSYCQEKGKDRIIFVTKEDHETPSTIVLSEDPNEEPVGAILPNGEINWNCPCLGGMATGPCGVQFREAFSCFHFSKEEPKGSDCFEKFDAMQHCMREHPNVYPVSNDDEEKEDENNEMEFLDANGALDATTQPGREQTSQRSESNRPNS